MPLFTRDVPVYDPAGAANAKAQAALSTFAYAAQDLEESAAELEAYQAAKEEDADAAKREAYAAYEAAHGYRSAAGKIRALLG
jgi:hypothetical protein